MKYIGIVGSRRRDSEHDFLCCVERFLEIYEEGDYIVSGGCPQGGDAFAEIIAQAYGVPISIYYPKWEMYGKRAGFIRNSDIAENSDVLIAMVTKDRELCRGTMDTVKKVQDKGKPVFFDEDEEEFDIENIGS